MDNSQKVNSAESSKFTDLKQQYSELRQSVEVHQDLLTEQSMLMDLQHILADKNITNNTSNIFNHIVKILISLFHLKQSALFIINQNTFEFEQTEVYNINDNFKNAIEWLMENGYFGKTINESNLSIQYIPNQYTKSYILIPLFIGDNPIGLLLFSSTLKSEKLTQRHIYLSWQIGIQLAFALEQQRMFNILENQNQELTDTKRNMVNVLNNIVHAVFSIDNNNKVIICNSQAESIFNLNRDNVLNKNYLKVFPAQLLREVEQILKRAEKSEIILDYEIDYITASGLNVPLSINATPVLDNNAKKQGMLFLCRDQFVIKEIINLKKLDQMKTDFVSNVSHELRTPLGVIKGSIETLIEYPNMPSENRVEFETMIAEETDRLSEFVNNLLDISRIESGKVTVDKLKFNLEKLIKNVINSYKIKESSRTFIFKSKLNKTTLVYADKNQIHQVIMNLIDNACKYSDKSRPVEINLSKENKSIICHIKDYGKGIPKHCIPFIFDKFYRVTDNNDNEISGTGLGLNITREMLKMNSGSISIKSTENEGSTFSFTLPMDI